MKENTKRTNLSLKLDSGLVSFLKTQENHKFSRYDAFVWLMEHIQEAEMEDCDKPSSAYQECLVRYTELAKTWHWSRPTVQKFIEGLEAMSVIIKKTCQCFCAVSYRRKHDSWQPYGFYHHPPHYRTDTCIATFAALFDELAQTDKREAKIE